MRKKGFVLIELAIVFGMLALLIGMTTLNIYQSRRNASLRATIDTLVADIKSQQTKSMTGTTDNGGLSPPYGIHFDSTRYILFSGESFNGSLESNAIVPLDSRVTFDSITLSDGNIIFASKSGELIGFTIGSNSVSVHHMDSGETKTIQFNQYGTITSIQ